MPNIVRIFVSSPADVFEERECARSVIGQLQRHFGDSVDLRSVFWEDLPLQPNMSFQEGIDIVLSNGDGIDIAVFILWSRLGSPVGGLLRNANGDEYRSGTEREFELMMAAKRASEGRRPAILFYTRDDREAFASAVAERVLQSVDAATEAFRQYNLAQTFIREQFQDERGRNLSAYFTYEKPRSFSNRLLAHLRQHIDAILRLDGSADQWTEAPYRGLASFEPNDAPIFFGRDEETRQVVERLAKRELDERCGFVAVVGASGSGKSSLVKAGVVAAHIQYPDDPQPTDWRTVLFVPGGVQTESDASLARRFVDHLIGHAVGSDHSALPEILDQHCSMPEFADLLHKSPEVAVQTVVLPAIKAASRNAGRAVKVLVFVDQFEELYSNDRISTEDRRAFLVTLRVLSRSGAVRVVVTLRSDYLAAALQDQEFIDLKGIFGQFELLVPRAAALRAIITEPARRAGLEFEHSAHGKSLADVLLDDAATIQDSLPLLEFVLRELYEQRAERKLTLQAYEGMGGLAGAIGNQAEKLFRELPLDVQAAADAAFWRLASVNEDGTPVRRKMLQPAADESPVSRLVRKLVESRFATASGGQGQAATVVLAHDFLLSAWPRLRDWLEHHRQKIEMLRRIEAFARTWENECRKVDYLLPVGEQIIQAESLVDALPDVVERSVCEFVQASAERARSLELQNRGMSHDVMKWLTLAEHASDDLSDQLFSSQVSQKLEERASTALRRSTGQLQVAVRLAEESVLRARFVGTTPRSAATKLVVLEKLFRSEAIFWNRVADLNHTARVDVDLDSFRHFPPLFIDDRMLQSALLEVVDNAMKATGRRRPRDGRERPRITVQGTRTATAFHVAVSDFGIGFSAEETAAVFHSGVRGRKAQMYWVGQGLGLWRARTIMESFGGTVQIIRLREPTVVEFVFPLSLARSPFGGASKQ